MRYRRRLVYFFAQILGDQFDERAPGAGEQEGIFWTPSLLRNDRQILGEKLRFAGNGGAFQVDRLAKRLPVSPADETILCASSFVATSAPKRFAGIRRPR